MERIPEDLMQKVLSYYDRYDPNSYTDAHVRAALSKNSLSIDDFGALLSPAAAPYLEQMAQKAKQVNQRQFGNSVCLYTPLYIANYCTNHCVYCGFNCKNKINRGKLTLDEIDREFQAIADTGLREILILTGESRHHSDLDYIGQAVELAKKYFSTIGIEIYPLNSDEYRYLHEKGADFVSVYQETYNQEKYREVHLSGPKRDFSYRFNAQERALMGGMRGVSVGALLGLDNFRKDAFATGLHAKFLQQKYPHGEIGFSVPRMRPYKNNESNNSNDVHEPQLLQVMLAYRLFLPFAGISISTRERAGFRDNVLGLAATRISAGVKTGVGGHEDEAKGDEQFQISDPRSVDEIRDMLKRRGFQEVFTDYIRL
jgi:2-iminoacetate synthase